MKGVPLKGFSEIRLAVKGMGRLECGGQHNSRKPLARFMYLIYFLMTLAEKKSKLWRY